MNLRCIYYVIYLYFDLGECLTFLEFVGFLWLVLYVELYLISFEKTNEQRRTEETLGFFCASLSLWVLRLAGPISMG